MIPEMEERFIKLTESINIYHLNKAKNIKVTFDLLTKKFRCKVDGRLSFGNVIDGLGDAILLGLLIEDVSKLDLWSQHTEPHLRVWFTKKEDGSCRLKDHLPNLKGIINGQYKH